MSIRVLKIGQSQTRNLSRVRVRGRCHIESPYVPSLSSVKSLPNNYWARPAISGEPFLQLSLRETCNEVEQLIRELPDNSKIYVDLLSGHGDQLIRSTAVVLLDWLEDELRSCLDASGEDGRAPGRQALGVVEGLHGTIILDELRKRRGSPLEEQLVGFCVHAHSKDLSMGGSRVQSGT